jgi:hypothetical protein
MCEQCLTAPLIRHNVLPGWHLLRARREGNAMKLGEWGRVRLDNPDFIWSGRPLVDPTIRMSDEEYEAYRERTGVGPVTDMDRRDRSRHLADAFAGRDVIVAWRLVQARIKAGFDPDGRIGVLHWLDDHLARHIEANPPEREDWFLGDPEDRPMDLTLGVD